MSPAKNSRLIIISALLLASQTSCIPVLAVGGAGAIGYTASQDSSVGSKIDDAAIEAQINAKFIANSDNTKPFAHVTEDSVNGRVLLTGSVPNREVKVKAYNLAWQVKYVKEVVNELKVDPNAKFSAARYATDTWISTQLESRLLFTKGIKNQNYSVETIDGVVYLMGIAQSKDELDEVTYAASQINGVVKVISYVKIKTNTPFTNNSNSSNNGSADTIPVEQTNEVQTVPGSVKAGGGSQNAAPIENDSPTGSGPLVIEESPKAQ